MKISKWIFVNETKKSFDMSCKHRLNSYKNKTKKKTKSDPTSLHVLSYDRAYRFRNAFDLLVLEFLDSSNSGNRKLSKRLWFEKPRSTHSKHAVRDTWNELKIWRKKVKSKENKDEKISSKIARYAYIIFVFLLFFCVNICSIWKTKYK